MKGKLPEKEALAQTPTMPESTSKMSSYLLNLLLSLIKAGIYKAEIKCQVLKITVVHWFQHAFVTVNPFSLLLSP